MAYSVFAEYYDALTQNVAYKQRAAYFDSLIKTHTATGNLLLDLGCGTGSLSLLLAGMGYDVIGADISPQMLLVAQNKAYEAEKQILFVQQDMRTLDLYGTVDIVISAQDSLNHLATAEDVLHTFKSVNLFLNTNGLFIFDINTVYKHKCILGNNTFVIENEDIYCVWQNHYQPCNNSVDIELDFFEKNGNHYIRATEAFTEFAYPPEKITQMLTETGFEVLAVYEADKLIPPTETTQRIVFVARNRKEKIVK